MTKKKRVLSGSLLFDVALLAAGAVLYAAFIPHPAVLTALAPSFFARLGEPKNAVYLVAGLPAAAGLWGLLRTLFRLAGALVRGGKTSA